MVSLPEKEERDFVQFKITLAGPGRGEKIAPRGTYNKGHKYVRGSNIINIFLLKVLIDSTCQGQGWLSSHQPGFWEPIDSVLLLMDQEFCC